MDGNNKSGMIVSNDSNPYNPDCIELGQTGENGAGNSLTRNFEGKKTICSSKLKLLT